MAAGLNRRSIAGIDRLEPRRLLTAPFAPDASFGDGGSAAIEGGDVQVLSDGTITLVSSKDFFGGPDVGGDFDHTEWYQTRLNADGTPDETYGVNGTKDIGTLYPRRVGSQYFAFDDASGNYVDEVISLQRNFHEDNSFSDDGRLDIPFQNPQSLRVYLVLGRNVEQAPDGGLLVEYWQSLIDLHNHFHDSQHVLKLNADGSTDTSFGNGGYLDLPDGASLMSVSSHGILARLNTTTVHQLLRYTLDGKPDQTFGRNGVLSLSTLVGQVQEQASGKLIHTYLPKVNGVIQPRLYRLNVDGSPDRTFGDNGSVSIYRAGGPTKLAISILSDAQGRIWVSSSGKLFRLSVNGAAEGAPFNGTFPLESELAAFDRSGGLLALNSTKLPRYEQTPP